MMPRYRRPPLTAAELDQPGPPVRLRDLIHLSGLSSPTIRADITAGALVAARRCAKANSPYFVVRSEARRWLLMMGCAVEKAS